MKKGEKLFLLIWVFLPFEMILRIALFIVFEKDKMCSQCRDLE